MTTEIKLLPFDDFKLGRHVVHDERSREFAFLGNPRKALASVRHQRHVPFWDQVVGSCTGMSALGCIGTGLFFDSVKHLNVTFTHDEAQMVYSKATFIDPFPGNFPPTDTGSSGLAVAKVVKDMGLIESYSHAFSFESALAALQTRPVITGVEWFESFYYPDANGVISKEPGTASAGGHEFILDEIDVERQLIGASNSWGPNWGKGGRFYIPFALYRELLAGYGDVTVFNPVKAPVPVTPPTITVSADDNDRALWAAVSGWSKARHYSSNKIAATNVRDWARKKGLTL